MKAITLLLTLLIGINIFAQSASQSGLTEAQQDEIMIDKATKNLEINLNDQQKKAFLLLGGLRFSTYVVQNHFEKIPHKNAFGQMVYSTICQVFKAKLDEYTNMDVSQKAITIRDMYINLDFIFNGKPDTLNLIADAVVIQTSCLADTINNSKTKKK